MAIPRDGTVDSRLPKKVVGPYERRVPGTAAAGPMEDAWSEADDERTGEATDLDHDGG